MATLATGTITFASTKIDAGVKNCNITQISGIEDITTFDNADAFKTKIATFKDWNGSMDIVWAVGNTYVIGESGALAVTIASGPSYSGTVIITNRGLPMVKDGVLVESVTFEGTGALT